MASRSNVNSQIIDPANQVDEETYRGLAAIFDSQQHRNFLPFEDETGGLHSSASEESGRDIVDLQADQESSMLALQESLLTSDEECQLDNLLKKAGESAKWKVNAAKTWVNLHLDKLKLFGDEVLDILYPDKLELSRKVFYQLDKTQVVDLANTIKLAYPAFTVISPEERADTGARIDAIVKVSTLSKDKLKSYLATSARSYEYWSGRVDQLKDATLWEYDNLTTEFSQSIMKSKAAVETTEHLIKSSSELIENYQEGLDTAAKKINSVLKQLETKVVTERCKMSTEHLQPNTSISQDYIGPSKTVAKPALDVGKSSSVCSKSVTTSLQTGDPQLTIAQIKHYVEVLGKHDSDIVETLTRLKCPYDIAMALSGAWENWRQKILSKASEWKNEWDIQRTWSRVRDILCGRN